MIAVDDNSIATTVGQFKVPDTFDLQCCGTVYFKHSRLEISLKQ
jgi:hypothetical protein